MAITVQMVEGEEEESQKTTIQVFKKTRNRLDNEGKKRETYDDVINRLLDICSKKK